MFQTGEKPLYVVAIMKYTDASGQEFTAEHCEFLCGEEYNRYLRCNTHNVIP
jgi:hypothetical protein